MARRYASLAGFILAGGESRRMGLPKANLPLGRERMLERQVRLLRSVCRRVSVVGMAAPPPADVPVLTDDLPGCGALGGIYTALRHCGTEYAMILGCDLPFLDPRFLGFLASKALALGADVTVPEAKDEGLQPLCAVYRRSVTGIIRSRLEAGQIKVSGFFSQVRCRVIPWQEIAKERFAPWIFANMNTPEDYESAKRVFALENNLQNR